MYDTGRSSPPLPYPYHPHPLPYFDFSPNRSAWLENGSLINLISSERTEINMEKLQEGKQTNSSPSTTSVRSFAHLPTELWVHILRQAFDWSESWKYDTTSRMRSLTAAWSHDETYLPNDGQEQRGLWDLRLVSRSWNVLLLPLLFESLVLWGTPRDLDLALMMMQQCVGADHAGRFARHLAFRFDELEEEGEMGAVDDVATQLRQIIELCDGLEELLWIAVDDLPRSLIPAMKASRIRKLHFRDWQDNPPGEALLNLAAHTPCLRVLGLVEACIDMEEKFYNTPGKRLSVPNLQHIALRVTDANAAFIRALGMCDLPRLTSVVGDAYQSADIDSLHPLLLHHGKSLTKLVLLYPHAPKSYDLELSSLALCPMLEEYVTHLPLIQCQRTFPPLLHLRRIGLFGFVPAAGSFSEPLDAPERQNWWDAKKGGHESFLTSLGKASLPALESVTLFDLSPVEISNWTRYIYWLVARIAKTYEMQNIILQNADRAVVKDLVTLAMRTGAQMYNGDHWIEMADEAEKDMGNAAGMSHSL